jgi:hypothetical protein
MSGFFPILVACLLAGLVFAYIGYLIIRHAPKLTDAKGDPTRIKIGPIEVSTGNAIVAIFIVSAIGMIGIPAYWLYTSNNRDDAPITFETRLEPKPASVTISSEDYGPAQIPQIKLYRSSNPQHFSIAAAKYDPVEVEASYNWSNKQFDVIVDSKTYQVSLNGVRAALPDSIKLHRAELAAQPTATDVPLAPSIGLTSAERSFADPPAQVKPQ